MAEGNKKWLKNLITKLDAAAFWVVFLLAGVILLFVLVTSMIFRWEAQDSVTYLRTGDHPGYIVLAGAVTCLALLLLGRGIGHIRRYWRAFDWFLVLLCAAILCILTGRFLYDARITQSSDAEYCIALALRFLNSDFGAVVPAGSYLSVWPYQTGLIFILEKLMRLFHTTDPLLFQWVNVFWCMAGFVSGYGIVREFTDSAYATAAYLLIAMTDFSFLLICGWVYGNVPEFNLLLFSTWMFLRMVRKTKPVIWGILGMGGLFVANLYKTHAKLYLIVLLLTGGWLLLKKFDWRIVGFLVVSVLLSANATLMTTRYYEAYAHNTTGRGMPASAWIAMGLQGTGGWNGFHSETFLASDYDNALTDQICKASIRESLEDFRRNPGEGVRFFYTKWTDQWTFETWGAWWNLQVSPEEEAAPDYVISILEGRYRIMIEAFSNLRLSIVYLLELLGLLRVFADGKKGKKTDPCMLMGYVYLIGGFLFSTIWEAHAGYTVSYVSLVLPFAIAALFPVRDLRKADGE